MTSSRFGRVTKGRVFLYLVCSIIIIAIVVCYKNASNLFNEAQRAFEQCRQEQENTIQQLHVVSDYKQRLEKTLQTEKTEQQHSRLEFTEKLNEERLKCEKNANEAKLRFSSLQQHYNLLQTQHDDFKEECSKIQREQLDTINQLQAKLKEVQEEMKRSIVDKENNIHHIKALKDSLEAENRKLKENVAHLLKSKPDPVLRTEYSSTQFSKVIPVGNGEYLIQGQMQNDLSNYQDQNDAVLALPSKNKLKAYTPKTSSNHLNAVQPLNAPSPTPETSKSSTTKKTVFLPVPYQQNVPDGVVRAPDLNIDDSKDKNADEQKERVLVVKENNEDRKKNDELIDDRYKNVDSKAGDKRDNLKDKFNEHADHEDLAHEIFDLHDNIQGNFVKGPKEKKGDEMNADPNEVDYDGPNPMDEEGDDAADGIMHPDEAVRN